jgi:AraC-like DNA-binding protein
MGLSERTLHRRLSAHGLTFRGVLDRAQRRLAEGLLTQSDHSIAEIAFLIGFSEQSAFTRAFKRWANDAPAAFGAARRRMGA